MSYFSTASSRKEFLREDPWGPYVENASKGLIKFFSVFSQENRITQSPYFLTEENITSFTGYYLPRLSAKEAISLILLSECQPTLGKYSLLDEIGEHCVRHQYQGEWMLVHKLLKSRSLKLQLSLLIQKGYTLRDVFGNFLKGLKEIVLRIKFRDRQRANKPVKYAQRKRGYDDHGSCVPDHKKGRNIKSSGANPNKLDLRESYAKKFTLLNWLYG